MSTFTQPDMLPHLVSQLQTVERIGGVWVEGLREEAQGEGEIASQAGVPV